MIVELVLFVVLVFLVWKTCRKPPGLPPGRWGLPLVGYIPLSTTKTMEDHITDLHKQHGDIVVWRMGTEVMVFLNDYKLTKEAFSRPEISDRPDWETFKFFEDPAVGVGSSNGLLWHNNRRFTLRQLRDLGMGKSRLVDAILYQGKKLQESIGKLTGKPTPVPHHLYVSIINIIWQMVASCQFDAEDERLKGFVKAMDEFILLSNRLALKDFLPWLENIMPSFLFKYLIRDKEARLTKDKFFNYFYEEINAHRATLDPNNPRDFIDSYLIEMEEKKNDPDTTCSDSDLAFLVFDLFFAGSETTAVTMRWMCCYLAAHPKVQDKVHAEIDAVLPDGTLPTLAEKPKMPYMEAMINEVMRVAALVNLGVQHKASTDTHLGGYLIPKGTIVSSNVSSMQYDSRYWDNPNEFRPERWLDEEGKVSMKKEGFLPFGVGKRACVGESLARMEMFIFSSMLFQRFSISPPPGKTIDLTPDLSGFFFRKPKYNEFVFTERKSSK